MSPEEIVTSYLLALSSQDFDSARRYLQDDMTFEAPIAKYRSADEYFEGNAQLRQKFHVTVTYDIKKVFVDGDEACALFEFSAGKAAIFAAGWFKINNGKISSIRVVFDPSPLFQMSE